jgi:hypothetical protein
MAAKKSKATIHNLSASSQSVGYSSIGVSTVMVNVKPIMNVKKRKFSLAAQSLTCNLSSQSKPTISIVQSKVLAATPFANDSPTINQRPVLT